MPLVGVFQDGAPNKHIAECPTCGHKIRRDKVGQVRRAVARHGRDKKHKWEKLRFRTYKWNRS